MEDGRFVFFDFNHPENIPKKYEGYFDMLVIDPPYVTKEVWEKYAEAIKFILSPEGKIILSTLDENKDFI